MTCARPAFSLERLSWRVEGERVVYQLPKPHPDGTQYLELGVNDLLDRLATLIPPPRRHHHRYHGVLAPNATLRHAVTSRAGQPIERTAQTAPPPGTSKAQTGYIWKGYAWIGVPEMLRDDFDGGDFHILIREVRRMVFSGKISVVTPDDTYRRQ